MVSFKDSPCLLLKMLPYYLICSKDIQTLAYKGLHDYILLPSTVTSFSTLCFVLCGLAKIGQNLPRNLLTILYMFSIISVLPSNQLQTNRKQRKRLQTINSSVTTLIVAERAKRRGTCDEAPRSL